jgi:hypothetical protein
VFGSVMNDEKIVPKLSTLNLLAKVFLRIFSTPLFFFGSAVQRGLWPPVAGYGLLSQAMASCRRLWPPVAGYGLLSQVMASSFTRFLDYTQRRATFGRTPLDE